MKTPKNVGIAFMYLAAMIILAAIANTIVKNFTDIMAYAGVLMFVGIAIFIFAGSLEK